jgi:hypothetical protein
MIAATKEMQINRANISNHFYPRYIRWINIVADAGLWVCMGTHLSAHCDCVHHAVKVRSPQSPWVAWRLLSGVITTGRCVRVYVLSGDQKCSAVLFAGSHSATYYSRVYLLAFSETYCFLARLERNVKQTETRWLISLSLYIHPCSLVFFFSFSGWGETESTWYVGHCWPIVPAPGDRWWLWSIRWNEDW